MSRVVRAMTGRSHENCLSQPTQSTRRKTAPAMTGRPHEHCLSQPAQLTSRKASRGKGGCSPTPLLLPKRCSQKGSLGEPLGAECSLGEPFGAEASLGEPLGAEGVLAMTGCSHEGPLSQPIPPGRQKHVLVAPVCLREGSWAPRPDQRGRADET